MHSMQNAAIPSRSRTTKITGKQFSLPTKSKKESSKSVIKSILGEEIKEEESQGSDMSSPKRVREKRRDKINFFKTKSSEPDLD